MKGKRILKTVDPKYSEIFKVWNEPRVNYENEKIKSKRSKILKFLLHPVSILFMITVAMVTYTIRVLFVR